MSLFDHDIFFSICIVPIGIILCFGPALLAYIKFDSKGAGKGLFEEANPDAPVKAGARKSADKK